MSIGREAPQASLGDLLLEAHRLSALVNLSLLLRQHLHNFCGSFLCCFSFGVVTMKYSSDSSTHLSAVSLSVSCVEWCEV